MEKEKISDIKDLAKRMKKSNYMCMLLLRDIKMKLELKQPVHEPLELLTDRICQQDCVLDNVIESGSAEV